MRCVAKKSARLVILMAASLLMWTCGCSGSENWQKLTLEGNLLDYPEGEFVEFSISGKAICTSCDEGDQVPGLMIDLSVAGDPTHTLAMETFDGLGHFSFPKVRAPTDAFVQMRGTLYRENAPESSALHGFTSFQVPIEDGEVVALILSFPSSESDANKE